MRTTEPLEASRHAMHMELRNKAVMHAIASAIFVAQLAGWVDVVDLLFAARVLAQEHLHASETGSAQ